MLAGCSTTRTAYMPTVNQAGYVVRERNPDPEPSWARDFGKFKRDHDGKGTTYFMGESGPVDDRIAGCDIADLAAKKDIAQEIAELISDKIATDKQGRLAIDPTNSNDPGMKRAFEERLAGKSIAFLSGVRNYDTYWERRDYSKSGGNKRVYECSVVVTISNKDMEEAIRRSSRHAESVIEDPDAKAAVTAALKDVDQEFSSYEPKEN